MKLSILIPTYNRERQFKRLFSRVSSLVSEEVEIVVACSSPEYLPESSFHITCLNTKGFGREENYLKGITHCKGEYTIIVEDDDLINEDIVSYFMREEKADLYVYSLMEKKLIINPKTEYLSSNDFISSFYERYGNTFQWGQCITKTSLLKEMMTQLWVQDWELDLIQSDELITLMVAQKSERICVSEYPLLWVGRGIDNYSWNNPKEEKQRKRFRQLLGNYINILC